MKKRYILPLLLVLLVPTSCENFLSVNPQSQLTQEAFPTTASDAGLATNAAYTVMRGWHYHSGGFPILDIMSDDAHKGSNPNDALNTVGPYDSFTHSTTQDGLDRWWNALYQGILRANVVIEKVPSIAMEAGLRDRYVAEAKFLRAVYYFDLVRAFGGVPLVTTTTPALKIPRNTADQIYDQVEADLLAAIPVLPEKTAYGAADLGRASKGAAKALLAKVYLFRGNFPGAEQYALEVITSGLYDLEALFTDGNSNVGEHGVESVFEIGAMETPGAFGNQYANTQGVRGSPNKGWGFNRPSVSLRNAFETNDPRLKGTIIDLGDVIDGVTIIGDGETPDVITDGAGNVIEIESYNRKIWIPGSTTTTQYGHNRRLIRFSDVLLMAAEALNENNKPVDALVHLNRVRARARQGNAAILPDITTTDKTALRDLIIQERRVELAMEGHRFWDLVRTGKAASVLGSRGFVAGKHELLPIPQNEIDLSQGTLIQNPNW
jgi:starch-binding outer membrane protein, SusD/RagB family